MNKKALFFDVDATLIDDKTKEVPKSAIKILKEVRNKGHLVFINSGRVQCLLDNITDTFEVDGVIAGCGTQIIVGDKTIYEHQLSLERCNQIKDAFKKYSITGIYEAKDKLYMPKKPFEYPKVMDRIYSVVSKLCEVELDKMQEPNFVFNKFCFVSDMDKKSEVVSDFIDTLSDFDVINRGRGFYECVPLECSKGKSVEFIMDKFGIADEDAYIFGDSMNDFTMFTCRAKNKILMGKHDEKLEKYSTFITKTVMEDGVEYAIKQLNIV